MAEKKNKFFSRFGTGRERDGEESEPETSDEEQEIKRRDFFHSGNEKKGSWLSESGEGQLTIDVYQTENDIIIKSTIAGVQPEDLDVEITKDMVTIRGRRERDEEILQENYYYQECYWGGFSRSVILPADIDADNAEATLKNGILTMRLPKLEKTKTKKVRVRTA